MALPRRLPRRLPPRASPSSTCGTAPTGLLPLARWPLLAAGPSTVALGTASPASSLRGCRSLTPSGRIGWRCRPGSVVPLTMAPSRLPLLTPGTALAPWTTRSRMATGRPGCSAPSAASSSSTGTRRAGHVPCGAVPCGACAVRGLCRSRRCGAVPRGHVPCGAAPRRHMPCGAVAREALPCGAKPCRHTPRGARAVRGCAVRGCGARGCAVRGCAVRDGAAWGCAAVRGCAVRVVPCMLRLHVVVVPPLAQPHPPLPFRHPREAPTAAEGLVQTESNFWQVVY